MRIHRWMFLSMMVLGMISAQGCAVLLLGTGVAVGAGAVAFIQGELKTTEAVKLDRAYDASEAALSGLKFPIHKHEKDALSGTLASRTSDDREITVRVTRTETDNTEIAIRVGVFGDEALSRQILTEIRSRLSVREGGRA